MRSSVLLAALAVSLAASPTLADWRADIGYTSLKTRLGGAVPTGAGIEVTQVEATEGSGHYMPDANNAQFVGKTLTRMSGGTGFSSHATSVAANYCGLTGSIAPGISVLDGYEANDWLLGVLNLDSGEPPASETRRTQNHSWIGTWEVDDWDRETLMTLDLLADRDGVVIAAAVNNGAASAMPKLLAPAYNVLAVGLTNGNSSYGPTLVDIPGRAKPDIVVPFSLTSFGTPVVASSAALLLQAADANNILSNLPAQQQRPAKALLVKTLLMAGATKTEFANWCKGFATPNTDGSVPLDYRYGAGELNIDNSHRILTAGQYQASASADAGLTGWDYGDIDAGIPVQYFLEVPAGSYAKGVSILAAWNRHVEVLTDNETYFELQPSLANIDLHLFQAGRYTPAALVDRSVSTLDNVEHIYLTSLPAGRYVFQLTSDQPWPYAIAWDIATAPAPASPDPADSAAHVPLASTSATLTWNGGGGMPGATFDVYFDTVNPPAAQVAAGQPLATCTVTGLSSSTTYYWKAVANDAGGQAPSPVWSFTTTLAGDIDGDGYVNVGDLQLLVAAWGSSNSDGGTWSPYADLNSDGCVNVGDLQLLVANWGRGYVARSLS